MPTSGGAELSPAIFADITAVSWLRLRAGVRADIATWGYSDNAPNGQQLCAGMVIPKNVTVFLLAPFLDAAPKLAGGDDWDVHALVGVAMMIPLGNGAYESVGGTMSTMGVPGLSFASPIESAGEIGIGTIFHRLTIDAIVRINRVEPAPPSGPNALDFHLLSAFLLSVGYTRW